MNTENFDKILDAKHGAPGSPEGKKDVFEVLKYYATLPGSNMTMEDIRSNRINKEGRELSDEDKQ